MNPTDIETLGKAYKSLLWVKWWEGFKIVMIFIAIDVLVIIIPQIVSNIRNMRNGKKSKRRKKNG